MFDFERQFSPESATRIVAAQAHDLSVDQRQRDVFESHRHRVFAVGFYMTADELEAEYILTETFISAFATQREPDAAAVDRAMVGQLERHFSLEPAATAIPDADLALARMSTRRTDMEEALRVLPPAERLVFLLKDVEGYPADKIADLLDRSEKEVQRTLFSARIRMRNALATVQNARKTVAIGTTMAAELPNHSQPVEAARSHTPDPAPDPDGDLEPDSDVDPDVNSVLAMDRNHGAENPVEETSRGL